MSVPELINIKSETQNTLDMYGSQVNTVGSYAYNCLLAPPPCRTRCPIHPTLSSGLGRTRQRTCSNPHSMCGYRSTNGSTASRSQNNAACSTIHLLFGAVNSGRTVYCQGKLTKTTYGRDHHPSCFSYWLGRWWSPRGNVLR